MINRGTKSLSVLPRVLQLGSNGVGTWAQAVCLWRKYLEPLDYTAQLIKIGEIEPFFFQHLGPLLPLKGTSDISALSLYSMLAAYLRCSLGKMKQLSQFHFFFPGPCIWSCGSQDDQASWLCCPSGFLIVRLPITFMACYVEKEKWYSRILFLWRNIVYNNIYIQTQTRCIHIDAHQTRTQRLIPKIHTDAHVYTETYTHRNTQINLLLSFHIIFFAVKSKASKCSLFHFPFCWFKIICSISILLLVEGVFFYIVVFITYPSTYIFIIKTRVIISLCPSLDDDKNLYFSLCFLYFQCSYNTEGDWNCSNSPLK